MLQLAGSEIVLCFVKLVWTRSDLDSSIEGVCNKLACGAIVNCQNAWYRDHSTVHACLHTKMSLLAWLARHLLS